MEYLPFEKIRLILQTITEEMEGLDIILHHLISFDEPCVRVAFKVTPYFKDPAIRKIQRTNRIFFTEIPLNKVSDNRDGIVEEFVNSSSRWILDKTAASDKVISLSPVRGKNVKSITDEEWEELGSEYNKEISLYDKSSSDKFVYIKLTPRGIDDEERSVFLTAPYHYYP